MTLATGRLLINDLGRHNHPLLPQLEARVRRVLESGWYILGAEVAAFERAFAAYCGTAHCVGVGNGTDALELALRALEIGPGDQVATVANAGGYSTTAIRCAGAEPLYVDVEAGSMRMDPASLRSRLTARTKAIIVTHLYGGMAAMPALLDAAAGIPMIEDCAQAHGARLDGKRAGAWGGLGCFSFYPTKNLGALGDGGAVVTVDATLAERLGALRQYGWIRKYEHGSVPGRNSRLDEIQAAILSVKLPRLDAWNARRREISALYSHLLHASVETPALPGEDDVAHLYVIRSPHRDRIRAELDAQGIATDIHYPIPDADLPVTRACCAEILTLPCFPEMTDDEVTRVAEAVRQAA
jgi:dTDP-3-amino-2,3,6-trideoxy-4-keto-D-glucose/dTDP-3-amino-3,4,6-trideoxy-alpha-D-glucose/dTDP-2,6-dideoxy-D-kanosamine transaminase